MEMRRPCLARAQNCTVDERHGAGTRGAGPREIESLLQTYRPYGTDENNCLLYQVFYFAEAGSHSRVNFRKHTGECRVSCRGNVECL
jgi:hypothetical protein